MSEGIEVQEHNEELENMDPEAAIGALVAQVKGEEAPVAPPQDPNEKPRLNSKGEPWKDPKENQPGPDHPKYGEVVKEKKKLESVTKDLSDKLEKLMSRTDELFQHNQTMAQELLSMSQGQKAAQEQSQHQNEISKLSSQIDSLEASRQEKRNSFEHAEADRITEQLFELRQQLKQAEAKNIVNANPAPEIPQLPPEHFEKINEIRTTVVDWAKDIPWIGNPAKPSNPQAFAIAQSIENALATDPEWKDKSIRERLDETRVRVEKALNIGGGNGQQPRQRPSGGVEGVSQVGSSGMEVPGQLTQGQKWALKIAEQYYKPIDPKEYLDQENYITLTEGR